MPEWYRLRQLAALMALVAVFPYLPALDFGFFADDATYLGVHNQALFDLPWHRLHELLQRPFNPWEFLPVRDFSYWLDIAVWGPFPDGFHASNLLWYALTCVGVGFAATEAVGRYSTRLAAPRTVWGWIAVAVFAAHPAHVEVVAWISGRKDLLAGLFCILSWGGLLRGLRKGACIRWLAASVAFFVLACFSKSVSVSVAAILALTAWGGIRERPADTGRLGAYLVIIAVASLAILVVHVETGQSLGIRIENAPGWAISLERSSRILAMLLKLCLVPVDLRIFHDVYELGAWHWLVSCGAIVSGIWAFRQVIRNGDKRLLAFGILWVTMPMAAYLQWVPFTTWSMASERFVFLSSFGGVLLLIWALGRLRPGGVLPWLIAVPVAGAMLVAQRVDDWGDASRMWAREAELAPTHYNAVRQHVQTNLVKPVDVTRAQAAIARIERGDARRLLAKWLELAHVMHSSGDHFAGRESIKEQHCRLGMALLSEIRHGYAGIPREPDIPYNNFLRNLENSVDSRGRLRAYCERQSSSFLPGRKIPGQTDAIVERDGMKHR